MQELPTHHQMHQHWSGHDINDGRIQDQRHYPSPTEAREQMGADQLDHKGCRNLNPKIDGETDGDTRKLLGNVEERTFETDAQYHNYCERSVQLLKKFVRKITGTRKDYQLQTLNKTEAEFIFELASKLVNKIPYGKNKDHLYISPADVIQQSDRMISVT